MPNYKTHSIHSEVIFPEMDKRVDLSKEEMKLYSMGPDALFASRFRLFELQHISKSKEYFLTMLNIIKTYQLQDDPSIMAFLYGQLDHYALDVSTHPLIYYYTEGLKKEGLLPSHAVIEHWIDDYFVNKYCVNNKNYYQDSSIKSEKLFRFINQVYSSVYDKNNIGTYYNIGFFNVILYDTLIRRHPFLANLFSLSNTCYSSDIDRVKPYLNLGHDTWYHPITGKERNESFDDLWDNATNLSCEMIHSANKYLYDDKNIDNYYLLNDISYNTGLLTFDGENFQYIKRY